MLRSTAAASSTRCGGLGQITAARTLQRPTRAHFPRSSSSTRPAAAPVQGTATPHPPATVTYKQVLVAVLDTNPYLGGGSRQALATAAALSQQGLDGHVTVLVLDSAGAAEDSTKVKMETVTWHLRDQGSAPFDVLEAARDSSPAALIGDMVDQLGADVLVLSSEVIHAKAVDANLLAEFVSCPLLLLP